METLTKDIKDYLHLYVNSEAKYQVQYVDYANEWTAPVKLTPNRYYHLDDASICSIKLTLRRLEDMTEGEAREFCRLEGWGEDLENVVVLDGCIDFKRVIGSRTESCVTRFTRCRPAMFVWLLSKGFDLFDLIPAGLAIDKKTLK